MADCDMTSTTEDSSTKSKMKRKKKPYIVPKGRTLELPPCRVCGGKASGIHYGVNSCEACKGFFRRYLLRKEPYVCSNGGNCEILDQNRGNCSACRMKKCLDLGMSKEGIRVGRYTLTERTNAIREIKMLETVDGEISNAMKYETPNNDDTATDPPAGPSCPPRVPPVIKVEEASKPQPSMAMLSELQGTNQKVDFISIAVFEKLMVRSTPVNSPMTESQSTGSMEESNSMSPSSGYSSQSSTTSPSCNMLFPLSSNSLVNEGLSPNNTSDGGNASVKTESVEMTDDTVKELSEAYLDIRPHSKLTPEEIAAKLQEGYDQYKLRSQMIGPMKALSPEEYNQVFEATNIDVDGRKSIMDKCGEMMIDIIRKYVSFSHKIPGFASLPAKDQANLLKASRFEFFMMLEYRFVDPDLEMMMIFTGHVLHLNEAGMWGTHDLMKSWQDFTRLLVKLELTNEEVAIMMAISITFSDRCKLQNPDQVERIQLNLVEILHELLKGHHGSKGNMWFGKVMDIFTTFRSFTAEFHSVYQKMCKDEFLQKHVPEMLEFMFDE